MSVCFGLIHAYGFRRFYFIFYINLYFPFINNNFFCLLYHVNFAGYAAVYNNPLLSFLVFYIFIHMVEGIAFRHPLDIPI